MSVLLALPLVLALLLVLALRVSLPSVSRGPSSPGTDGHGPGTAAVQHESADHRAVTGATTARASGIRSPSPR